MADDIDIEEHDVLEDLRTRGMLPDIANVKTEPTEYDDEDVAIKQEDDAYEEDYTDTENPTIEPSSPDEYPQFNNKIILGTKPKPQPHRSDPYCLEAVDGKVYNSIVYLEEWGDRLCFSKCYCKDCEILFPTRNALDAHNMVAHSFLVARPSHNMAVKSTAKTQVTPTLNVARKSTTGSQATTNFAKKSTTGSQVTPNSAKKMTIGSRTAPNMTMKGTTDPGKFCNHCKMTFSDNTSLIKHLYEHLPSKVHECDVCNDVFDTAQQLDEHKEIHLSNVKNTKDILMCPVCFTFFQNPKWYDKHCKINHGCKIKPKCDVKFTGRCPFCTHVSNDIRQFQKHAYQNHTDQFNKKLKPVPKNVPNEKYYYYCKLCSCYYSTSPSYSRHLKVSHSGLPKTPYPRNTFNPKCEFCSSIFENTMDYNTHIRSEHKTSYKKNNLSVLTSKKIQKTNQIKPKYKCKICNEIVIGKNAAVSHRAKHPESKKKKFMTKSFSNNFSDRLRHTPDIIGPLIPRGVVFKCDKCSLHFLISQTAERHRSRGCKAMDIWNCGICKRMFKPKDQTMHLAQHKADEKIKAYTISAKLYHTVICHCVKCKVYYDEYTFWRVHSYETCEKNISVYCDQCKRNIYGGCFNKHLAVHKEIKTNEFITISFAPLNSDSLTRKLTESMRKARFSFKHYYYCNNCKAYFIDPANIQQHIDASCADIKKIMCNLCGLLLPIPLVYRHRAKHDDPQFDAIKNSTFICIQDMEEITPPIPEFLQCKDCGVSHLSTGAVHQCSDKRIQCKQCNRKYNGHAFKVHKKYHNLEQDSFVTKSDKAPTLSDDIPALLKSYLSIQPLWNILYQCESCDVVTDTYDQVIEHSQMHFNGIEKCDVFKCGDCLLTFHSTCYVRHCQLHADNHPMNKDSFKIIKYDYTKLATLDVWLTENRSLTTKQMSQITSRSIYRYSKCIKFDVIQKSDPECMLYKCGTCLNCVDPRGVIEHVRTNACSNRNVSKCTHCNLTFNSEEVKNHHENQHGSVSEFGMIIFNSEKDKQFNKAINAASPLKSLVHPKSSTLTMYKCIKCTMCMTLRKSAPRHICSTAVRRCPLCKNNVFKKKFYVHQELHRTYSEFDYIHFNPKSSGFKILSKVTRVAKLYKCKCGLHFMSESSIQKHYQVCGEDSISKERCSKCNLLFPTNVLVSHLCNHHTDKCKIIVINAAVAVASESTDKKIVIYRCGKCDLHYNTYKGLYYHFVCKHTVKRKVIRCDICKLRFTHNSAKDHMKLHTEKSFNLSNISFITRFNMDSCDNVRTKTAEPPKTPRVFTENNRKVYKCSKCPVHFMTNKGYLLHRSKQIHFKKDQLIKCKVCRLRFTNVTYEKHVSLHHEEMGLKLGDLRVMVQNYDKTVKGRYFKYLTLKPEDMELSSDDEKEEMEFEPISIQKTYARKRKLEVKETSEDNEEATPKKVPRKHKFQSFATSYEDDKDWKASLRTNRKQKMARKLRYLERNSSKQNNSLSVDTVETDDGQTNERSSDSVITLHKCKTCGCHFVTQGGLFSHMKRDRHITENQGVNCEYCGLLFTKVTVTIHVNMHHNKSKLKHVDFRILKYSGKLPDEAESSPSNESINEASIELFQCEFCYLHFMSAKALRVHLRSKNHLQSEGVRCEYCKLIFSKVSLESHKMIHHNQPGLNVDPKRFNINVGCIYVVPFDGELAPLYKCDVCLCHFIEQDYYTKHMEIGNHINENDRAKCNKCGLFFSKGTIDNHYFNHHESFDLKIEDFKIIEGGIDPVAANDETNYDGKQDVSQSSKADEVPNENSLNASNSSDASDTNKTAKKYKLKLYKCGECNVYFLTQSACYKHASKHMPIDPMEYIECKICSLQFNYATLHIHMKNHHFKQKFDLEDLLVEEYRPAVGNDVPKIDIYCAVDRVQSRLVSTTTEDAQEPSSSRDEVGENSNCESVKATEENQDIVTNEAVDASKYGSENNDNPGDCETESNEILNDEANSKDECVENVSNEMPKLENTKLSCKFCRQEFKSRSSLGLHESLEHLDAMKQCPFCQMNFNESILNEIHLGFDKDTFKCCLCLDQLNIQDMDKHTCNN